MQAEIKGIHSPDVIDIDENYRPENKANFCFLLQLLIGPKGIEGAESFDITICTPKWIETNYSKDEIIMCRHYLIMLEYDYKRLMEWLHNYVSSCTGETWQECAGKLSRLGRWEFEDYTENPN